MNLESFDRGKQGLALTGLGVLLGLIAALIAWGGLAKWMSASHLQEAAVASFHGKGTTARKHANDALSWHESVPAIIASVDPLSPDADKRLNRAQAGQSSRGQAAIRRARAYVQAEQDLQINADKVTGIDGRLLNHVKEIKNITSGRLPELPGSKGQGPDKEILSLVLEQRMRVAWRLGDTRSFTEDCGRLQTITPKHRLVGIARAVLTWLDPDAKNNNLSAAISKAGGSAERVAWIRCLRNLTDADPSLFKVDSAKAKALQAERRLQAAQLIPRNDRTAVEEDLLAKHSGRSSGQRRSALQKAVTKAKEDPQPATVATALNLAFAAKDFKTAETLIPLAPKDKQASITVAMAEARWDLAALHKAGPEGQRFLPKVSHLRFDKDGLRFHLVSSLGVMPPRPITVQFGSQAVRNSSIQRIGSAFFVRVPSGTDRLELAISVDGVPVFSEIVRR